MQIHFLSNEYSNHIQINEDAAPEADSSTSRVEQGAVHSITESEYAELTGEDLDVPELEEEKKEGILSKAISFFTKIFKIRKRSWSLKKQRSPERVDGSAADTKKSDDEEFQEHETVDGADETTDSDDIDNKNSSDSDGEIWIPRKLRIRMRKIRRIKVR